MEYKRIKLETRDNLAIITLNHPEVLNAISSRMLDELKFAMTRIGNSSGDIRCLLITGAGRGFCSGANLSDTEGMTEKDGAIPAASSLDNTYNPLFLALRSLDMPVITVVNGPAAGIGMSLALMGDIVLAGRSAYFLQAFRNVGLVPDGGISWVLPRLVGLKRAMELSILAERLPAEKALEWGMINRVYDDKDIMSEALKLAESLASGPTAALGMMRKIYWESPDNTYERQLHLECLFQQKAGLTEDAFEGRTAFNEKRDPVFRGK